jgi:hypothetical protein
MTRRGRATVPGGGLVANVHDTMPINNGKVTR